VMRRFSVIGAGNLGCYLIDALVRQGYFLTSVYKKAKSREFEAAVKDDIRQVVEEADFVVISTQESQIRSAVEMAASGSDPRGKIFFHTSNALTSEELHALKEKGAPVASFSPLQTFPEYRAFPKGQVFNGTYFLVEGDPAAVHLARQIAADLGAHCLAVEKDEKIYFHIAGVAASNFLIAILKLAEAQLKKVQKQRQAKTGKFPDAMDLRILLPLIRQTLDHVETRGVAASLTGPVQRKEKGIIQRHLEALEADEAILYKTLSDFISKRSVTAAR
jgi:predicted short-subunit dehydrogenase-like oxidoreductase (DUF2520 family)